MTFFYSSWMCTCQEKQMFLVLRISVCLVFGLPCLHNINILAGLWRKKLWKPDCLCLHQWIVGQKCSCWKSTCKVIRMSQCGISVWRSRLRQHCVWVWRKSVNQWKGYNWKTLEENETLSQIVNDAGRKVSPINKLKSSSKIRLKKTKCIKCKYVHLSLNYYISNNE